VKERDAEGAMVGVCRSELRTDPKKNVSMGRRKENKRRPADGSEDLFWEDVLDRPLDAG
jgi:hypothetical protein